MVDSFNPSEEIITTFRTKVEGEKELKAVAADLNTIQQELKGFDRQRQLLRVAQDAAKLTGAGGDARLGMIALRSELEKFGGLTKSELKTAVREYDRMAQSIERAETQQRQLNDEIKRQPQPQQPGGGRSQLTQLGFEVRNLPSIAIPGAGGLTTDALGNFARIIGQISGPDGLPKLSTVLEKMGGVVNTVVSAIGVGPLALIGALFALSKVIELVGNRAKETHDRIQNEIQAAQELAALRITETVPSVVEHLKDLNQQMRINETRTDVAREALKQIYTQLTGFDGAQLGLGELQALLANMGIQVGEFGPAIAAANEAIAESEQRQQELSLELGVWNTLLYDNQVAQNTANAALKESNELLEKRNNQLGLNKLQDELFLETASAKAIQDRITALANEKEAIQRNIDEGAFTGEVLAQQLQRVDDITNSLGRFLLALPLAQEIEKAGEAEKFRQKQIEETAAAVEKSNEKIEALLNQRAEREAAIYGKLNDDIIRAAEKAAADSERALERLQEQRNKGGVDLARGDRDAARQAQFDDLENRIKFQQDEAKSFRDHLRTLRGIREDAQAQEEELGRNRDFAGLRRLRLETNRSLKDQTRQFIEQNAEQETAFKLQIQDEQRRREFERESRLIRYQDAITDAEDQAKRELALIQRNKQREIQALRKAAIQELTLNNQKHRQALSMQQQAISAELGLIAKGQAARLDLERRHQQALLAQAAAIRAQSFLGNIGNSLVNLLTGRGATTNNVNTTFNLSAGTTTAQQRSLESFVDARIASALRSIGATS